MIKRQHLSIALFALLGGCIGGILSHHLLRDKGAYANNAPSHKKVVRSESFTLVDKNGDYRGELRVQEDGNPSLILADKNGTLRLLFLISEGKINLNLKDINENTWFSLFNSKSPTMNLFDKDGHIRASLSLDGSGVPSLMLKDENDLIRAALGGVQLESPKTGTSVKRAVSSLVLFGVDGKVFWSTP
jgi:hypothetical protein